MKEIIEGQCLDDVPVEEAEEAMEMELAGPSEETETPAGMATDPEEGSGLLSILMDAIEEKMPLKLCVKRFFEGMTRSHY